MITRQGLWCSFGLAVSLALAGCGESTGNSGLNDLSHSTNSAPAHVAQKPVADPEITPDKSVEAASTQPSPAPVPDSDPATKPTATPEVAAAPRPEPDKTSSGTAVADKTVTPASATTSAAPATTTPRKVQLLVKEKSFVIDPKSGSLRLPYDALDLLKVLNMEKVTEDAVSLMPPWQRALDGKEIIIRGFMRPQFSETGLTEFLLVPDIKYCCFGPNPAIYDMVEVHMAEGTTTDYIELRPFDVQGTFHIKMRFEDGFAQGLYSIDDARIIQK